MKTLAEKPRSPAWVRKAAAARRRNWVSKSRDLLLHEIASAEQGDPLLLPTQTADLLGIERGSIENPVIYRLVEIGELTPIRNGVPGSPRRFKLSDVLALRARANRYVNNGGKP